MASPGFRECQHEPFHVHTAKGMEHIHNGLLPPAEWDELQSSLRLAETAPKLEKPRVEPMLPAWRPYPK